MDDGFSKGETLGAFDNKCNSVQSLSVTAHLLYNCLLEKSLLSFDDHLSIMINVGGDLVKVEI